MAFLRIVIVACLFAVPIVSAQNSEDARELLHQVAQASRDAKTYRADGHIAQDLDIGIIVDKPDFTFHIATRSTGQMRQEVSGRMLDNDLSFLAVCNSQTGWIYYARNNEYLRVTPGSDFEGACNASNLTTFAHVDENVKSAVISGHDKVNFEGKSQDCVVVQAEYRAIDQFLVMPGAVQRVGRVSRKMCIDPARKLILRDYLDADLASTEVGQHVSETITYEHIERDPQLSAELFEFRAPEGAKPFTPPPPPVAHGGPPSEPSHSNLSHVMAPPERIFETKPEYSQEAWDEGVQGEVILTVRVETNGAMHDFKVEKSLGWGLDEKAVECVRKWRFKPATDDGKPVPGAAYIVLNFDLPDRRPAQPSPFAVTRLPKVARLPESRLDAPTDLDNFFNVIASRFKAPDLCARINPQADGGGGDTPGLERETLQSDCYYNLASELQEPSLCDHVKPVRIEGADGSKFTPAYCRQHPLSVIVSPDPYRMGPFVGYVQQAGFGDGEVADFVYEHNPYHNPVYSAYASLRNNPEFFARVQAGPNFNEPESAAKVRFANALEYLYQMLAVDSRDPALCARISPNARIKGNRLLRTVCVWNIAVDKRDTALCADVPETDHYPSRKDCYRAIQISQEPGAAGDYGPERFQNRGCSKSATTTRRRTRCELNRQALTRGLLGFPQGSLVSWRAACPLRLFAARQGAKVGDRHCGML